MRTAAIVLSLMMLVAAASTGARAGDAEIEAINAAAAALDQAFEKQDIEAVKKLMTSDHVAVTPYYRGPQSVDDQIASLPDLDYGQAIVGEVKVELLTSDTALRTFAAKLKGSFKGRPLPRRVFVSEIWVKRDGAWAEKFYQVTSLRHAGHKLGACKGLVGTYLTKNMPNGASADSFTSRSLISLGSAHLILFTDSGESGEAGFAPFTDGRGSWYCLPGKGGALKISATTLDFTAPATGEPKGGIGRLDFDLTLKPGSDSLEGTATLYLIPLGDDPLDKDALKDGRQFEITGQRIRAP
jgi:ketosteroid isomerase-like protein